MTIIPKFKIGEIVYLGFSKFIEHYKPEGIIFRNKYFKPYSKK